MIQVFLERDYKGEDCTLGRMWFDGEVIHTLELPWKNNKPNISCIPEGTYTVKKEYSPKFKKMLWEFQDVPDRTEIKFHAASFVKKLQGCIAPGLQRQDLDKDGTVDMKNSRKALSLMQELLPNEFKIDIIWNRYLNT